MACALIRQPLVVLLLGAMGLFSVPGTPLAGSRAVALPSIDDSTISPRVLYIENPRFPRVTDAELATIVQTAAGLVKEHFGITLEAPSSIKRTDIDDIFSDLAPKASRKLGRVIGDFRNGEVDWARVKGLLIEQIESHGDSLDAQIAFAAPYLTASPSSDSLDAFADALVEAYRTRLAYWTTATLDDGYPIIGKVPGREDLPLNEYVYWALMAKLGVEAEIILTNQLVASVEYIPTPIHSAIRGGISGGSSEYNPNSRYGASVWVSVAPFLMDDGQVTDLRDGKTYRREDALQYAGVLLAHEIGHQILHLGHPWSNEACLMRPAEVLDFEAWSEQLDADQCPIGSDAEMTPGVLKIPVW